MGMMQRRKRIARELSGMAPIKAVLRPKTWKTVGEFEADAPGHMISKQYAEALADAGMCVWYDAGENVIKARKAWGKFGA